MNNNSPHWENDRVTRAIQSLQGKFVLVGKRRVRSWHMWLVIGIAVGAIVGVLWVANRTNEFSSSKAATAVNSPQVLLSGMSAIYSPMVYEWQGTKHMLMGGFLTNADANDFLAEVAKCGGVAQASTCEALNHVVGADKIFLSEFKNGQWTPPVLAFSKIGYHVNDPTVVKPPSSGGVDRSQWLYMYYTALPNQSAPDPETQIEHNRTGFASSVDGGQTWTDHGVVIDQNNGTDNRGAWAPSAIARGDEIWVYYHTNKDPSTGSNFWLNQVKVYRTRFDATGFQKIGPTEALTLTETHLECASDFATCEPCVHGRGSCAAAQFALKPSATQDRVSGANVDIAWQDPWFVLTANCFGLTQVCRYVSTDGLAWTTALHDKNPILSAEDNTCLTPHAEILDWNRYRLYCGRVDSASGSAQSITVQEIASIGQLGSLFNNPGLLFIQNPRVFNIPIFKGGVLVIVPRPGLFTGESREATALMINTGAEPWTKSGGFFLATQNPPDNQTWGINRIDLGASDSIPYAGYKKFIFKITAPKIEGTYHLQLQMRKNDSWFGDITPESRGELVIRRDNVLPTVRIVSPASGVKVKPGKKIAIEAAASDDIGVEKVELFSDGVSMGADTASPYQFSWSSRSKGMHTLTARATDLTGNTSEASISIEVNNK